MEPSITEARDKRQEAEDLRREAEEEEKEAKSRAQAEKVSLDAERDRELQRVRDYYESKKHDVDHRYGLA